MMRKILFGLLILVASCALSFADTGTLKPYQKGDWHGLIKAAGQPVVVHFWGVTCTPCAKEMPLWGKFLSQDKDAKVIFIQVDEVPLGAIKKMLSQANLDAATNFYLNTSFDDYLRYEIDPQWRGETPMTLLIDKSGKVVRKTGPINFIELKKLFAKGV
jgi:thiol-disulfide isomerase/thioredoxin